MTDALALLAVAILCVAFVLSVLFVAGVVVYSLVRDGVECEHGPRDGLPAEQPGRWEL